MEKRVGIEQSMATRTVQSRREDSTLRWDGGKWQDLNAWHDSIKKLFYSLFLSLSSCSIKMKSDKVAVHTGLQSSLRVSSGQDAGG